MRIIRKFLKPDAISGLLLFMGTVASLIMKNSSLENTYVNFLQSPFHLRIGEFLFEKPLLLLINDGLMAVFFLLVGLELKREILRGQLSSFQKAALPLFGAIGGLAIPALIYIGINWNHPDYQGGWAIPTATDIAFAIGVMALLSNRIPDSLKICLLAIAIIDDLASILIIAFFYSNKLSFSNFYMAAVHVVVFVIFNQLRVQNLGLYAVNGLLLWFCVLKSGVHATLAGVVMAFFIPLQSQNSKPSPLFRMEKALHPWVAYGVLPLFAFANAGVSFKGLSYDLMFHPITLGIAAGLFIGKQIGVMGVSFLVTRLKLCTLPTHTTWVQYYGMAALTGIGFTMSLFIGTLAFPTSDHPKLIRLGVISGSVLSGVLGYLILRFYSNPIAEEDNKP